jgi:diguanylate cyclase
LSANEVDHNGRSKTAAQQRIRMQRLHMGAGSYLVATALVVFAARIGELPWNVAVHFMLFVATTNAAIYATFLTGFNLRFRDPSLTAPQMLISVVPVLFAMYHIEDGQVRAAFLLMCVVPAMYGLFGLGRRQLSLVTLAFVLAYAVLVGTLYWQRPHQLDGRAEVFLLMALMLVMTQVAYLGGQIGNLRARLHERNVELRIALDRIQELANRDGLTGIFNRRRLMQLLESEAASDAPFSICILDVDHFKTVNDVFGHQAGDEVLRRIATVIERDLRRGDVFGRYGGEEFMLMLPGATAAGAEAKIERLREQVATLAFPDLGPISITLSGGIAEHRPGENLGATISRADAALYGAKAAGRNQLHLATAEAHAGLKS